MSTLTNMETTTLGASQGLPVVQYEFIDSKELASRWALPESWVREQVRLRTADPLPHVRFGKYVRFRWGSPELGGWAQRRIIDGSNRKAGRSGFLWEDYDGEQIRISQLYWRGHVQEPKTKKSKAPVPVIAQLAERLNLHRS